MTPLEREKTYRHILELSARKKLFFTVGIVSNTIIDAVGIREANSLAMQEAIRKIQRAQSKEQKVGIRLIIDGRDNYQFDIP
jgi:ribonuclease HII